MKNSEILCQYKRSDLRKLAKGKISEIVGMNAEKILVNLSKVLGNYESIRNNIEFKKPPCQTILEVLFEAPDHAVKFENLRSLVIKKIKECQKLSKDIDLDDPNKRFRLYATVLDAAWEYEGDLLHSEANILRVLRKELGISRKEHQYIMAHPQINRLFFDEDTYRSELEYLSREGIILVYKKGKDDYFVLSDETADSLKELWGIELEPEQFLGLLDKFSNPQLSKILKTFNLPYSGTQEEMANRIISNEIKPSELLSSLSVSQLSSYLKKIKLPQYGRKEERVLKIIDHFKSPEEPPEPPKPPIDVEPQILSEGKIIDLLSNLTTVQLSNALQKLKLMKSGSKTEKIERLANSRYNIETILSTLKLGDISDISRDVGLMTSGRKLDLIKQLICHYRELVIKESKLPTKELFRYYTELSCQDDRIYPQDDTSEKICTTTIGLDFERATRYLFRNIFNLETKTQRFGKEDPDGVIRDDEGNIFFYECKTVLNPPYSLPISHRLQIRNYIEEISKTKDKEDFRGYIIISHSFPKNIQKKLQEIKPALDIPISVIEAKDLAAFAKKWETDYPTDTFPIKQIIKNGQIALSDFEQVLR